MTTFLTPYSQTDAIDLSGERVFRKQILPFTTINYTDKTGKSRQIRFDHAYATDLAEAFRQNAFDSVAFILAGKDNEHTLDPTKMRGVVKGIEVAPDGLDAILELSQDAADLVRMNPRFGVSARIVENLVHSTGQAFKCAIHHVLGTLDPKIPGMRPWQAVDLSIGYNPGDDLIDLTSSTYQEGKMPKRVTLELSEEQETALAALGIKATDPDPDPDPDPDSDPDPDPNDDLTDAEIEALLAGIDNEPDFDPEPVSLSVEDRAAIDLANTRAAAAEERANRLQAQLAEQAWEQRRAKYLESGIPPALVDLAKPLIAHADAVTIDLSNGRGQDVIDATGIVTKMLDHFAGVIELSGEQGYAVDFANERAADDQMVWPGLDDDAPVEPQV